MLLKASQIEGALKKKLAPVYFISGDEPLQLGETADVIRQAAATKGYENREVFTVETGFNWSQVALAADSLSIFSEQKVIDLRLPSAKPGMEGAKALVEYCQRLPDDTLLLITAGKIAGSAKKSNWYKALDKVGVVIQVWPLEGRELIQWLQRRMQDRGIQADTETLKILAGRVEGNLLAAAQEIEKLYVLYGSGHLTAQSILESVADNSRYDVFKLIDSLLAKQVDKMLKILSGIKTSGIAEPVVLWALTREARLLLSIQDALFRGENKDSVFKNNQIWDKRKSLINGALNRLSSQELHQVLLLGAKADRQIKGEQTGDPWETLLSICLVFTSVGTMMDCP